MSLRLAAFAALVVACGAFSRAHAGDVIDLDTAFARVEATHPDLKLFRYSEAGLRAEADKAAQKPPLVAGLALENAFGSGAYSSTQAAELTVSLASVLERGGKRAARTALAASRIDALGNSREAKRLDLLAEVARRYLDLAAAQAQQRIATLDREQRERTLAAAKKRVQAGASPLSVQLAADAALARTELDLTRAQNEQRAAARRLALLWGERDAGELTAADYRLALPPVPEFGRIAALLDNTPDITRFADEQRVREARLQLARSARSADLDWQVGLRRFQDGSDWALTGSVGMALGAASRAQPDIRQAEAELESLSLERDSAQLGLYATLAQAHGGLQAASGEAQQLRAEVLPRLLKAESAAEQAYRAGALSYLEWAQLQSETTAARRQDLAAAIAAQRALIEIQRLTATNFGAAAAGAIEELQ